MREFVSKKVSFFFLKQGTTDRKMFDYVTLRSKKKKHCWNFYGYSDLSAVEGIVGREEGDGKEKKNVGKRISHEVVVGLK